MYPNWRDKNWDVKKLNKKPKKKPYYIYKKIKHHLIPNEWKWRGTVECSYLLSSRAFWLCARGKLKWQQISEKILLRKTSWYVASQRLFQRQLRCIFLTIDPYNYDLPSAYLIAIHFLVTWTDLSIPNHVYKVTNWDLDTYINSEKYTAKTRLQHQNHDLQREVTDQWLTRKTICNQFFT